MPSQSHTLSHLPLRPSTLSLFEKRGFVSTAELEASKNGEGGMSNLAVELGISLTDAAKLMREVDLAIQSVDKSNETVPSRKTCTALSLLEHSRKQAGGHFQQRMIVSFSKNIDSLLGGGLSKSEVTEICGLPGSGKTQLAMQLCVNAKLPTSFGGVAGESIYIDTEGSFSPERCYTMAKALVDHVTRAAQGRLRSTSNNKPLPAMPPADFTPDNILDGIHVYRVHDEAAQTATIYSLPTFLQQRVDQGSPVKLVIIDSIAFHYRCAAQGSDFMARTRSLNSIAAFLGDLAARFDVAVICVNQMTTKIGVDTTHHHEAKVAPALGESWAHATTTRILLSTTSTLSLLDQEQQQEEVRKCTLVKSAHKTAGSAFYVVREVGIRDPPPNYGTSREQNDMGVSSTKRQRV